MLDGFAPSSSILRMTSVLQASVGGRDAVGSEPNHEASETAAQCGQDLMFAISASNFSSESGKC